MWHVVEPSRELLPSVAIDVIGAALQATVDADVNRLAISCPPGVCKSLLCSVFYPAWLLLRTDGKARIMVGSYSWQFAERDSRRCRDLVRSAEYAALVGGRWQIRGDADRLDDWWTTAGGRRLITSVDGKSTGERVDYQIIDDALSAADRLSDAARKEAVRWVTEVLPSRLDKIPPHNGVRVIVGQRLAIDDPIGVLLERDPDGEEWSYCCLPAVLGLDDEPTEQLADDNGNEIVLWRDPRKPGEPLFPGLDDDALKGFERDLGPSRFACEYGQKPANDNGALIKRTWWRFHRASDVPASTSRPAHTDLESPAIDTPATFDTIVIACDLTFGSKRGDFVAIQAWGSKGAGRYLLRRYRRRCGLLDSVQAIQELAEEFPQAHILIEKAANGAGAVEELAAAGVPNVTAVVPIGSKRDRIGMVSATIETGNCYLPLGLPGLAEFVEELAGNSKHDDEQDAAAMAIHFLNTRVDDVSRWKTATANLKYAFNRIQRQRHGYR
ncbi:MAG: hypothetical protein AB7O24_13355 [Kofleriaceae bacterium]